MSPPRMYSGQGNGKWMNGQEDDLIEERKKGLKDGQGDTWYLVSEPVGCVEGHDPVLDKIEALSLERSDDGQGVEEVEVGGKGKQVEKGEKQEETRNAPSRKLWVREITVKTLSKDQGWSSSNHEHYGGFTSCPMLTQAHTSKAIPGLSWAYCAMERRSVKGWTSSITCTVRYLLHLADISRTILQRARQHFRPRLRVCQIDSAGRPRRPLGKGHVSGRSRYRLY